MVPRTRRTALRSGGSVLAALLAGCLGGAPSAGGATRARTSTEPATPRKAGAPGESPTTPTTSAGPDTDTTETPTASTPPEPVTENVSVAWQADLGAILSRPAVAGGVVFVATSAGPVFAVESGEVRWRFPKGGSRWHAPAVVDGTVYVGGDGTLYALAVEDGTERWRHEWAGNMSSSPVIADGTLIIGNTDPPTSHTESQYPEDLWGLDPADGSVRWKRDLGENPTEELSGTPALVDGTLYAQMWGTGTVYALDPATGRTRWKRAVGTSNGPLAVGGGRVFASGNGGIVALDAEDGTREWRVDGVETAPVGGDGTVYAGSWDRTARTATVGAFEAAAGEERWVIEREGELRSWSALAAAPETALVNVFRDGRDIIEDNTTVLHAVDSASGEVVWRFARRSGFFARPTPADGRIYVASSGGMLYALDPE